MNLTLSSREQSAIRRILLADHDDVGLVSADVADALTRLVPCDLLQTGEGDDQGYVLRGVDYPEDVVPDQGPRVCDGPWSKGFEHLAAMPYDDPEAATARLFGIRDALRLGFVTSADTVVSIAFVQRGRLFTQRDVALLTMLEPALARLLKPRGGAPARARLTPGERRVLVRISEGLSNRQAAEELYVSEATVRKHLENAYRKLGVSSRTGAVAALHQQS